MALDVTGYYKGIELVIHKLIPTQWKKLEEAVYVYENILEPLKVLAPKTVYLTRESIASLLEETIEEEEEKSSGIVLKGGCRSYAGVPERKECISAMQNNAFVPQSMLGTMRNKACPKTFQNS